MPSSDETPVPRTEACRTSPDAGPWIGKLEQRDFDVEFYERILQRQPNDVRLLRLLGELYGRRGQYDRALEIDQRLVTLAPDDGVAHYNLACSLAMRGATGDAIESLGRAIELGYNDFSHLEVDPDLVNLRQMPQYQALLRQYGLED
jgi:tetratricopeptide (TPR) repeat protein